MNSGIRGLLASWTTALLLLGLPGISACANNALTFSPDMLPSAILYQPYQATITITGEKTQVGYIGVSAGSLPDGLKIIDEAGNDAASISGTPTLLGTFSFTTNAWCLGTKHGQNSYQKYTIVVTR
jgi:hypothetical protein